MRASINRVQFLLLLLMVACGQQPTGNDTWQDARRVAGALERTNVILIDAERQEIDDFIDRYGWSVDETGTGLRYWIYEKGEGAKVRAGMTAFIEYSIHLLNGDMVYSSKELGVKSFHVGQGGVESGLEEGMLLLRKGDKARFIIPSHLAHGIHGDGDRIPQRATIVYDLELVDLFD